MPRFTPTPTSLHICSLRRSFSKLLVYSHLYTEILGKSISLCYSRKTRKATEGGLAALLETSHRHLR